MKKVVLFGHGGSKNHGCEALVRTTIGVLEPEETLLFTYNPHEDERFGLGNICKIMAQYESANSHLGRLIFVLKSGFYNRILRRLHLLFNYQNKRFVNSIS